MWVAGAESPPASEALSPETRGLWDRSGKFYHSEEYVSTGYEPKDALFVEEHFLIN